MSTMKDKIDFMKTRLQDMEMKMDRKIDAETKVLHKSIQQTMEENRALEEHVG